MARDYEQVRRILIAAFGSNDFDAFELKLGLLPGETLPMDPAEVSQRRQSFRWNKPGFTKALDSPSAWTIALELEITGRVEAMHHQCPTVVVGRT